MVALEPVKAILEQRRDPFELLPVEVVRAAVLYYYNVDPRDQLELVRGQPCRPGDPYIDEKLEHYRLGFHEWFGRFDPERQEKWLAAAIAKYRDDVIAESFRVGRR